MSDPHDVEARRRMAQSGKARRARDLLDLAQAYRAAFGTDAGRLVLADLRRCYDGSTTGPDARTTERRSAQRDVLLRIDDLMNVAGADPDRAMTDFTAAPGSIEVLLNPWSIP